MSLIDIDTTSYSNNLPTILMSYNPPHLSNNHSERQRNNHNHQEKKLVQSPQGHGGTNQHHDLQIDVSKFPNLGASYQCGNLLNNTSNYNSNNNSGANNVNGANQTFNSSSTSNYSYNPSNDANKAFDNVVFDIFKVDPDDIAGQLTLIDLPLFKQIQPDELISCKWMSREKLIKAPNIVQFTRRFNQTTFWCQKEILNCKRIETRGKMITIFIKIAKRLYELHSFNSLMAIIVALKAQPIYRLKKTWSQYVSKRDVAQFERLADLMFDTNDNKRKIRDIIMNCKLPCIPFLGLFLTDLIHIDIAHPHNSFDNPQRRNQMNNICRLISEYQQSNYQDLTSLSCDCCFSVINTELTELTPGPNNQGVETTTTTTESKCLVANCSCLIHHGQVNGSGIINNDGTIYINDIGYIKNYLNSFLYIEELQKFKEDENYRDSLELEPEVNQHQQNTAIGGDKTDKHNTDNLKKPILHVSPSSPCKLSATNSINRIHDLKNMNSKLHNCQPIMDTNNNTNNNNNGANTTTTTSQQLQQHRKSQSIASNMFNFNIVNETKDMLSELKLKHPLDESIENTESLPANTNFSISNNNNLNLVNHSTSHSINHQNLPTTTELINEIPLSLLQQKQVLAAVKINDPSSLLRELLKHRHNNSYANNTNNSSALTNTTSTNQSHKSSNSSSYNKFNKFNCYSSSSADVDDDSDDDDQNNSDFDVEDHINNNSISIDSENHQHLPSLEVVAANDSNNINSTPIKLFNMSFDQQDGQTHKSTTPSSGKSKNNLKAKKKLLNSTLKSEKSSTVIASHVNCDTSLNRETESKRLSGRNLINSLNDDLDVVDSISVNRNGQSNSIRNAISKTSSSSDLFQTNQLPILSGPNDETSSHTTHDLSGITNLSNILALEQQMGMIMFESPVKRKCIMKNSRKPRFSQWKSYWLQLLGGNLLIYYPMKAIMFNTNASSNKTRQTSEQTSYIEELISNQSEANAHDNPDIHQLHQEIQQQQKKERLINQLQHKKICYTKNPCKMHPIANWMVVNLYQDKEDEIIHAAQQINISNTQQTPKPNIGTTNQTTTTHTTNTPSINLNCPHFSKFDIQLNDLNNGNMYKYRFDSLQLAKEWLEQFKQASTYHEREKPDNLIRFD